MRKSFALFLLAPAALRAAGEPAFDPQKLLAKSTATLSTAAVLLEAGEREAVSAFAEDLSARQSDLANKLRAMKEEADGNFAGAAQALENVAHPDGWTQDQKKRFMALAARAADATEHKSDHFVLSLPKGQSFLAEPALSALESAQEKAALFSAEGASVTIRVDVQPDAAAFALAADLPADAVEKTGRVSACRYGRVILLSPRAVPGGFRWLDALCAELHRRAVRRLSGGAAPPWLEEGISRRRESAWRSEDDDAPPADLNRLAQAALAREGAPSSSLSFSAIEAGLASRNQEPLLTARAEAADAAQSLLKKYGRGKTTELLAAFRRAPRAEAFLLALGAAEGDVESAWVQSLGQRTWALSKGALDRTVSLTARESSVGAEAIPFLKAGDALRAKAQWRAAAEQYKKALTVEPDNGLLLSRAAKAAAAQDDGAGAEELLRAAVEKNPFYVPPFVDLGKILYDAGRYDDAQQVLQEGLEIQPFNAALHAALGYISADVGDVPAARRSFQIAAELDPANVEIRKVLHNLPKQNH